MLTYYIGNIREKRKLFRKYRAGGICADNADVLVDFNVNGKVCFVLGEIPFGNMRVGEYLCYARALTSSAPVSAADAKAMLTKCGVRVPLSRRMRTLPRHVFRGVLLAAAVEKETRQVWLNLDGVAYSRRTCIRVRHMLQRLARTFADVHAAVSDCRFIPRGAHVSAVTQTAVVPGRSCSMSRPGGRIRLRRGRCKSNLVLSAVNGRKTLLCDN